MQLNMEVSLGPGHIVHCVGWGPSPLPKKGAQPPFSAHVCCGQMAGWIKMPLSATVGLGPGHIVLHGDPAHPPPKGAQAPNVRPMSIVAKRSPYHLLLSTCSDAKSSLWVPGLK